MVKIILSLFFLGLSFGWGPCLASCGPLLISYTAGTSQNIRASLVVYFLFSLSRILVYLVLGLVVFSLGQAITQYSAGGFHKYLFVFSGLFIILIGLLVAAGKYHQGCCRKTQAKTVLAFGLITGLLPCAPLISVVSYIGLTAKHYFNALIYSFAFGLGTAFSPLLLLMIFAGFIPKIFPKGSLYRIFNLICGLVIVFLGLQLLRRAFNA